MMMRIFLLIFAFCIFCASSTYADKVVWSGEVQSNGSPTHLIKLTLGKQYQIKVSGAINLGKWWQLGKPLADDACFEYNEETAPTFVNTLRNSMQISVCDGVYHSDHIYLSKPFIAAQNGIHFWICDTDYTDNSGALNVQVIELPHE
jgi:hypothetical protein